MKQVKILAIACLVIVLFGAGLGTGILLKGRDIQTTPVSADSLQQFRLVEQAWNLTRSNYVDRTATQPQPLAYGTIGGMIDSLGDTGHSTFLTPEEVVQQNDFEQGKLQGIGAEVQQKNGQVVMIAPLDGSPAQKAGLRSGDVILAVDGQNVSNVGDAVKLILGPVGTQVTLTILDSSGANRQVTITRAVINLTSVSWRQIPGLTIVHLRLSSFIQGTSSELDTALKSIAAQGAAGIILDLRDNPGGLLDEAIGVASHFLESGNVLLEKDINGKVTPVPVTRVANASNLPLVVLINGGTASAAEIVAGALHDAGRAKLIGQTTFGTGTVLSQFTLQDGSALVLAVEEWLTPKGQTIWHKGLPPDAVVALATGVNPLLPETEQGLTLSQIQSSGDAQLLAAINALTNGG